MTPDKAARGAGVASPRLPWFEEAVRDLGGCPSGPVSTWLKDVIRLAASRSAAWHAQNAKERARRPEHHLDLGA